MPGWVIQPEITSEDWTVTTELDSVSENNNWSIKPLIMNPNAAANRNILNASNWAAEELNSYPENVNIIPEEIQADKSEWIIIFNDAS